MCSILGIVAKGNVDWSAFAELCELNKQRGNLGFGFYADDLSGGQAIRRPPPFAPQMLPDTEQLKAAAQFNFYSPYQTLRNGH